MPNNTVELFVFEVPGNSPDGLLAIPPAEREKRSTFTRKVTLFAAPPPDTLLMRATGVDLSVFGEATREGQLQMIDGASLSKHAAEALERLVIRHPDSTVQAFVALAKKHAQPSDEAALRPRSNQTRGRPREMPCSRLRRSGACCGRRRPTRSPTRARSCGSLAARP